jgi:hypothetical protein
MSYQHLSITYSTPNNENAFTAEFNLLPCDISQRWAERLVAAQQQYPIDDPGRFYGFGSYEDQVNYCITNINQCADQIEKELQIPINRRLNNITDQDTLNYLHHIFEVHHGLLDQKSTNKLLSDLNILVHRCESVQRGAKPRHVVTYFGLPKTHQLEYSDYQYFTNRYEFGTVYLNYAEIGKTIEDLAADNDHYISKEAFKPFRHYTADFNVKFFDTTADEADLNNQRIKQYYYNHRDFFEQQGLNETHPYLQPGSIPVAKLRSSVKLEEIAKRLWVQQVELA